MALEDLKALATAELDEMVKVRRYLHMYPEVSFQEEKTSAYIASLLTSYGVESIARVGGGYGMAAKIDSGKPGLNIAFRADFDALALEEQTGLKYRSRIPGVMHACGHDAHTSVVLALGRVLARNKDIFTGSVTLIFQPAEETPPGGAKHMVDAGCMEGVDKVFAFHVEPNLDAGILGLCPGPYMAASDVFRFTVTGGGGHGSRPQDVTDVLSAACDSVSMINTLVSRRIPADEQVVISVCTILAGNTCNVLPAEAHFGGTVRTFTRSRAEMVRDELERAVAGVCKSYGAGYDYRFTFGYPVLVNDPNSTELVRLAVSSRENMQVRDIPPTTVAEDFSYYLARAPGCFFRVGIRNEELGAVHPLHHSGFRIDESAMAVALQAFLAILQKTGTDDQAG